MPEQGRRFSRLGLSLQVLVLVILPLTVVLMAIAVGSIASHQRVMQSSLSGDQQTGAPDPALEATLLAPLVLIAPLLFALAALWFGARRIAQPLQKLEARAAAVATGDYDAIREPVGGISEIQHLQEVLADMTGRVRASHEGLRDYIGAITSAQEEERLRLARELHDETIQELIALRQRLQLGQKVSGDPETRRLLEELGDMAEAMVANVRRMTRALRPIFLEDLGLATALEMLATETSEPDGFVVGFEQDGRERRLVREAELALFRIAQQALNNVVRHAQARHATIRVEFLEDEVRLEIVDDGIGFKVPAVPTDFASSGHFGLLGMRERADLVGARLDLKSEPARGTTVSVVLPVLDFQQ